MAKAKKGGYLGKFLKRADKAIQEGVKKADEALDDAVEFGELTAKQASKASKELSAKAKKESEAIQKKGKKKLTEGISSAKGSMVNSEEELATLEKLGQLRKKGIITEKEFQAKKKKILSKI
ncbi:MAG: SHOCT domain-containing protein [Nitrosopumilus sp.]|nr:SHOCT domain-containing protein [Nitrosopumilus sp.]NNL36734.1 SHOCT domain-containing protein [Nitrosopumilus sp.]NNM36234.1 SHOCT domain-containing protein [Nitrosopumilus sp.]